MGAHRVRTKCLGETRSAVEEDVVAEEMEETDGRNGAIERNSLVCGPSTLTVGRIGPCLTLRTATFIVGDVLGAIVAMGTATAPL